jgi:hypothetical protein
MRDQPWDETSVWSQPDQCRSCRYPVAESVQLCPACLRPMHLFSVVSGRFFLQRFRQTVSNLWGSLQLLILVLLGLTVVYYLSPLLLLFPLAALSADPPASRGGKTVVVVRRSSAHPRS